MRRVDAGLTRKVSLALVAVLVLTLAFAVAVSANPAEPLAPADFFPHCFYGAVATDHSVPLPGMLVVARAVTGDWGGTTTGTVDAMSRYGYAPSFCVPGAIDPGSGAQVGDQIAFYVNGVQARLFDVSTNTSSLTYTFAASKEPVLTNLNLIVPLYYTITPTAGTGCTITPGTAQSVPYMGNQSFTIAPKTGYDLVDVTVDGASQGAITSYNFTGVTANHAIAASCKLQTFVITPTAGPGGTITPGTPQTVNYGDSKKFDIAPDASYKILDVKVDLVSQGPITTYTFTNVTANHKIDATFQRIWWVYLPYVSK